MVLLVWYNICEKIVFHETMGSSKNPLGVERIFPSASKTYSLTRDGDRERERQGYGYVMSHFQTRTSI